MTLDELLMGGPGHDGYAYNADVYCVRCGQELIRRLYAESGPPVGDEANDSESWPQPIFFGESPDFAQHCGECGEHLYGPDGGTVENPYYQDLGGSD